MLFFYFRDNVIELKSTFCVGQIMHPKLHHVPRGPTSTIPKIYVFRQISALKVLWAANLWIDIDRLPTFSSSELRNGWTGSEGGQGRHAPLASTHPWTQLVFRMFLTIFFYF